jgi:hypothetical protein
MLKGEGWSGWGDVIRLDQIRMAMNIFKARHRKHPDYADLKIQIMIYES